MPRRGEGIIIGNILGGSWVSLGGKLSCCLFVVVVFFGGGGGGELPLRPPILDETLAVWQFQSIKLKFPSYAEC